MTVPAAAVPAAAVPTGWAVRDPRPMGEAAAMTEPARVPASASASTASPTAAARVRRERETEDHDCDDADAFHCEPSSCPRGGGGGGGSTPPCTPYATVRPNTSKGATSR
jgi:hypothetical protein